MLMSLGMFVFSLYTVSYHELQRQTTWRHPTSSRVGARPASQFVGPGDDNVNLSGVLHPGQFGSPASLRELREMADTGKAWALVSGVGEVFGAFVIASLTETGTLHVDNGLPRRIDFQLQLQRTDDQRSGAAVELGELGEFDTGQGAEG